MSSAALRARFFLPGPVEVAPDVLAALTRPMIGHLGPEMAGILARNHANVLTLEQTQLDDPFHTYEVDVEVQDLAHLTRIVSALRASDAVAEADRI